MDQVPAEDRGFRFLFRTDRGRIDRATWWRGTVPLAVIGLLATGGWVLVRPYASNALEQAPAMAVFSYLYLLAFVFGLLIILVCEYNLSAKRFFARGKPRALAALLPMSLLLAGAVGWLVPRMSGALPPWSLWLAWAAVAVVAAWNVAELGVRDTEPRS